MKRLAPAPILVAVLGAAACTDATAPAPLTPRQSYDLVASAPSKVIPGRYIVRLTNDVADVQGAAARLAAAHQGRVHFAYRRAFHGFSGRFTPQAAARLAREPGVAYVEADRVVRAVAVQSPTPSWGLDRVDQATLPLNSSYTYPRTGAGVTAYIIDTGINPALADFGARAAVGVDEIGDGRNGIDCNGHGTHVAGTVGGTRFGVAKDARIVAVRVLDCSGEGTVSGVIAGLDWVATNRVRPAVANMSLGGDPSTALDDAVRNVIAAGVTVAVAAGNGDSTGVAQDACRTSPARVAEAMTVSATDQSDRKVSWANYGTCVDIFAPGVAITSDWSDARYAPDYTRTISGTSMATPHVTGAAALYLEANPGAAPPSVASALTSNASANVAHLVGTGSPNRILYIGFIPGGAPANIPPTAAFTFGCTDLTCAFTDASSDTDGRVVSWSWSFGDGSTSAEQNPVRSYASAGSYTVRLTATDDRGAASTTSQTVSVTAPPPPAAIALSATPRVTHTGRVVDLAWSGASGASVYVYRYTHLIATAANPGAYTDASLTAPGRYVYRVCETGTGRCSNDATVTF